MIASDLRVEFVNLWKSWPRRAAFLEPKQVGTGALLFYCELVVQKNPLVMRGPLSQEDQFPAIKRWIQDAEQTLPVKIG